MATAYLGVEHAGCAMVLRKLSAAPQGWFATDEAKALIEKLRALAAKEGQATATAVDNALAIIKASA